MINFKPQKGKAFDKLPIKATNSFDDTEFIVSRKFDGNQIFITKVNNLVRFFTSDWKEFRLPGIGEAISKANKGNFVLIGEFMFDCEGKLGDRRKSAILTTLRTNFNKGIDNNIDELKVNIRIFDFIEINSLFELNTNVMYIDRINHCIDSIWLPEQVKTISYVQMKGWFAKLLSKEWVADGWEGAMCITPNSTYQIGKRVNYSVKLKYRPTADLLCIDTIPGEGKYEGMIGAIVLRDAKGRVVSVGTGFDDSQRDVEPNHYIGKIVEIEYEQIMDTYIQPAFISIRDDKKESE